MNKKILFITLVLALALSSCTTFKNQTLQIAGADTITEWQELGITCETDQQCIDKMLLQEIPVEEIIGRVRCNNDVCEVRNQERISIDKEGVIEDAKIEVQNKIISE